MTIQQAAVLVGQQQGLSSDFDGSSASIKNLPPEQKIALTSGLIKYINQHPGEFTEQQVSVSNDELGRAQTMTGQSGYKEIAFSDAFAEELFNAGQKVASIGTGVLNTASLIGNLLPVLALISIAIFAYPYIKKANNS